AGARAAARPGGLRAAAVRARVVARLIWARRLLGFVVGSRGGDRRVLLPRRNVMRFRTLFLFLVLAVTALFALLNWSAFTAPTTLSLVFGTVEAPLGLIMLGVVFVLGVMCLAYLIYVQGSALVESRRHSKTLQAHRGLAESDD